MAVSELWGMSHQVVNLRSEDKKIIWPFGTADLTGKGGYQRRPYKAEKDFRSSSRLAAQEEIYSTKLHFLSRSPA